MTTSEQIIINDEYTRLENKQKLVDTAIMGKKRMNFLNNNYFERNAVYTQIVITIVICLGLFIMITLLQRYFPIIPSVVTDLLSGLLFSIMIIYIGWLLYTISMRDNINFSEVNLAPPEIKKGVQITNKNPNNNLFNLFDIPCIGQQCCPPGSDGIYPTTTGSLYWDDINSKCNTRT